MSPSERKAAPQWDWRKPFWCSARLVSLLCINSLPWFVLFSSSISSSRWSPSDKSCSKTLRLSSDRQDTGSLDIPLRFAITWNYFHSVYSALLNREGKFTQSHFPSLRKKKKKLISVRTRWKRHEQDSGIWKAIPVCFPAAVRPVRLFSDYSSPGLRENYSGVHRWVNTSQTQFHQGQGNWPKSINILFPQQSRKMTWQLVLLSRGLVRLILSKQPAGVFVNCWSFGVQPHILLCCLQGMACSFQMVPGGSSIGGSWPRASTMMCWNHTWG